MNKLHHVAQTSQTWNFSVKKNKNNHFLWLYFKASRTPFYSPPIHRFHVAHYNKKTGLESLFSTRTDSRHAAFAIFKHFDIFREASLNTALEQNEK